MQKTNVTMTLSGDRSHIYNLKVSISTDTDIEGLKSHYWFIVIGHKV